MVLKLYGHPQSTSTRIVALVCKEKEIPYKLVVVDHFKGENKSPEYTKFQPFGKTPWIDDDGFILYESRAIARYLVRKYPNQGTVGLIPTDLGELALFEQAALTEIFHFNLLAIPLAHETVIKKMKGLEPDESTAAESLKKFEDSLDAYELILSKQKYLAGNNVTLADLQHLPFGRLLFPDGQEDVLLRRPNVARWLNDLSSRPSWSAIQNSA